MSHEIAQDESGNYLHAFKGAPEDIWHYAETKGRIMPAEATDDEVCNAAGFAQKLQRATVRYPTCRGDADNPASWSSMPGREVIINPTTKRALGIVSSGFQIAQPPAMRDLARMIAQTIDGYVDSAAMIFHGAGMFINIRAGEAVRVCGQDLLLPHFLLASKNDATMNTHGKMSDVRTVCKNTMQQALGSGAHARDFRLSHRCEFDPVKLAAFWALSLAQHKSQAEQYKLLAQTPVQMATAERTVFDLFNSKRAGDKQQDFNADVADGKRDIRNGAGYKTILGLFAGAGRGASLPGVRGTAWGLLNAVTEFADHHVTAKSESHRWESANFGAGGDMKVAAFGALLALATSEA